MRDDASDPVATLRDLRERHDDLLRRMEDNQGEFQRLARSIYRVQEEERGRIARELHDGVGQNLTALKHRMAMMAGSLPPEQPGLREALDAAIALCVQTLEDTRVLSRLLRPQVLDDLGLEAALHWLVRTLGESGGVSVTLDVTPVPDLEPGLSTVVFRIAQEALGNVVRHAHARKATVRLWERGGWLWLAVEDDGHGFDAQAAAEAGSAGRSAGLRGMHERARLYRGELRIASEPGGTRLRVGFPLDARGQGSGR